MLVVKFVLYNLLNQKNNYLYPNILSENLQKNLGISHHLSKYLKEKLSHESKINVLKVLEIKKKPSINHLRLKGHVILVRHTYMYTFQKLGPRESLWITLNYNM